MELFKSFKTQDERREYAGSALIEIQFCKLPEDTSIEEIVSVDAIEHWKNDSLYVVDQNIFYQQYRNVLAEGIYNNLKTGPVDIYGINYYAPALIDDIIRKIRWKQLEDCQILADWLYNAKSCNGFYILGI